MPRRLSDEVNELRIRDNISNSEIVLHYRMATTQEFMRYTNEMTQRKKNKLVIRMGQVRQKYGPRILEGFRTGDYERMVNGEYVPMASDPKSEHHFPEWKGHIKKYAPDHIEALAIHVFESSTEDEGPIDSEEETDEDEEKDEEDRLQEDGLQEDASPDEEEKDSPYAGVGLEKN